MSLLNVNDNCVGRTPQETITKGHRLNRSKNSQEVFNAESFQCKIYWFVALLALSHWMQP